MSDIPDVPLAEAPAAEVPAEGAVEAVAPVEE